MGDHSWPQVLTHDDGIFSKAGSVYTNCVGALTTVVFLAVVSRGVSEPDGIAAITVKPRHIFFLLPTFGSFHRYGSMDV